MVCGGHHYCQGEPALPRGPPSHRSASGQWRAAVGAGKLCALASVENSLKGHPCSRPPWGTWRPPWRPLLPQPGLSSLEVCLLSLHQAYAENSSDQSLFPGRHSLFRQTVLSLPFEGVRLPPSKRTSEHGYPSRQETLSRVLVFQTKHVPGSPDMASCRF